MFWDSKIDSEFRKVWQILNRFCCKVKSCLGISSQGNPDLVLNQQGNWIETQSYKVYTALLTQSGGDGQTSIYSGNLIIGATYTINDNLGSGWDFTNVGAPNNDLYTSFVATGTTPNSWGIDGQLDYNTGAPVVTVLENTIGNIVWSRIAKGNYEATLINGFTLNKTFIVITPTVDDAQNSMTSLTYNTTLDSFFISTTTWSNSISGYLLEDGILFNTPIEIRVYN